MINKELILREFGKTHNKGKKPYGAMKHLLNYGSITIADLQGYPFFSNGANKIKQALQKFFDERQDLGYSLVYELEPSKLTETPHRRFYIKEV